MWAGRDRLDPVGRGACRGRAPCQGADRLCAGVPGGHSGGEARRPIDRGGIKVKLAVVRKGGSGKTPTAAVNPRPLARRGIPVVASAGDSYPNPAVALLSGPEDADP